MPPTPLTQQHRPMARNAPYRCMRWWKTHGALRGVHALAAHPRYESLSFGVMTLSLPIAGAIPQWAMSSQGQFEHPLVVRAKLEIAGSLPRPRQNAVALRGDRIQRCRGPGRGG